MELPVDPFLQTEALYLFEIARPRAEGEAIERMDDFLFFGDRSEELRVFGGVLLLGGRGETQDGREDDQSTQGQDNFSMHRTLSRTDVLTLLNAYWTGKF